MIAHDRIVRPVIVGSAPATDQQAADIERLARRVATVMRGGVRAAILGVSDGLITNVCLILGIAGANASPESVRLAGFAALLAGAFAMAAGEWVSNRSQAELFAGVLDDLKSLVDRNPRLVLSELARELEAAGFARETARAASTDLPLDEPRFLRFSSQALFGVDPDTLSSPRVAAATSLCLFASGAFVPLAPWLVTEGAAGTAASLVSAALVSSFVGGLVSRLSGRASWKGALRQLLIVAVCAVVTFGVGRLLGTTMV